MWAAYFLECDRDLAGARLIQLGLMFGNETEQVERYLYQKV